MCGPVMCCVFGCVAAEPASIRYELVEAENPLIRSPSAHKGAIMLYPPLLDPGVPPPAGDTDSEAFFNFLMAHYDASKPIDSLRRAIRTTVERSPFSGLNFLFSDGDRLFAYRLGPFELPWVPPPRQPLGPSRKIPGETL